MKKIVILSKKWPIWAKKCCHRLRDIAQAAANRPIVSHCSQENFFMGIGQKLIVQNSFSDFLTPGRARRRS